MSLSSTACKWSAEAISRGSAWVYLWTFTTPDQVDGREIGFRCRNFLGALTHKRDGACPEFAGVRVFEPHPGGHGWHVHAIVGARFDVDTVRAVAQRYGFGRVHVKRIPSSEAGYVAKYVTKGNDRTKGMRVWSVFNRRQLQALGVGYERVCDLRVDSDRLTVFREAFSFAGLFTERFLAKFEYASQSVTRWLLDLGDDCAPPVAGHVVEGSCRRVLFDGGLVDVF